MAIFDFHRICGFTLAGIVAGLLGACTGTELPEASSSAITFESSSSFIAASSVAVVSSSSIETSSAESSSSSSFSSSSSSSIASGYNPCPQNGDPCKILPLGDSITDGYGTPGGYRIALFQKSLAAGKKITFVGSQMNGPENVSGQTFPQQHEGHSYWATHQLLDRVPSPALDEQPHIVLLMIGTNDVDDIAGMNANPSSVIATLKELISNIVNNSPNTLVVLAQVIPMDEMDYAWAFSALNAYNAAIPSVVKTFSDAGKHVVGVDMFSDYPQGELDDGIHPNAAGYSRMADVWYKAIAPFLR